MSEGNASGSSNPNPSKAVPSLVKKQSDVTRLGATKLKFVPTLPPGRRKKEDAKQDEAPAPSSSSSERGRGRGRGRGEDRGRGRGRGDGPGRGAAPPRPPAVEMTASGPFALGPAMAGSATARRTAPRPTFTPVMPGGATRGAIGMGLTNTTAPSLGVKKEPNELGIAKKDVVEEEEEEVYSDPDEGVEIIDMENVRGMDWMAPESLKKEKERKKAKKIKNEVVDKKGKGVARSEVKGPGSAPKVDGAMDVDDDDETVVAKVNLANALNLSDSEEEEELEDIIEDFTQAMNMEADGGGTGERLYFFQFPRPFPQFFSPTAAASKEKDGAPVSEDQAGKKVSFAQGTKPPAAGAQATSNTPGNSGVTKEPEPEEKVEGIIGQLEVYESGAVKMRLANGIVLDVTASTQPSFLQHAVHVDPDNQRLCVLGEVSRRFVVTPDVQTLLDSLEKSEAEASASELGDFEGLISMEPT